MQSKRKEIASIRHLIFKCPIRNNSEGLDLGIEVATTELFNYLSNNCYSVLLNFRLFKQYNAQGHRRVVRFFFRWEHFPTELVNYLRESVDNRVRLIILTTWKKVQLENPHNFSAHNYWELLLIMGLLDSDQKSLSWKFLIAFLEKFHSFIKKIAVWNKKVSRKNVWAMKSSEEVESWIW